MLGVHEGDGVVFLGHDDGVVLTPDVEHRGVYYVGKTSLRVISNRRPEGVWIITSTEEPPFSSSKADKISPSLEVVSHSGLPSLVRRKGSKVLGLEGDDDFHWELGLLSEGC